MGSHSIWSEKVSCRLQHKLTWNETTSRSHCIELTRARARAWQGGSTAESEGNWMSKLMSIIWLQISFNLLDTDATSVHACLKPKKRRSSGEVEHSGGRIRDSWVDTIE